MAAYARKYQLLPFVSYLSLFESNVLNPGASGSKGLSKSDKKRLAAEALEEGVILILTTLVDR